MRKEYREGETFFYPEYMVVPTVPKTWTNTMKDEPYSIAKVIRFNQSEYLDSMIYAFDDKEKINKFLVYKTGTIKRI